MPIKKKRYASIEAIQEEVTTVLKSIPKMVFSRAFERIYEQFQTCITFNVDYLKV